MKILPELVTDLMNGDPFPIMDLLSHLIEEKKYSPYRVLMIGLRLGLPEDLIVSTLFQMYGEDFPIFH